MKNTFIDCGSHFGEGLKHFINHYHITKDWDVMCFEPNEDSFIKLRKNIPETENIKLYKKAVWIKDGTISFNKERWIEDGWNSTGPGSSIFNQNEWKTQPMVQTILTEVECIDFSNLIDKLDGNIYVKMDIEGSEYEILRTLIKNKNISKIKEMHVEFHYKVFDRETFDSTRDLIKQVRDNNVKILEWF
jgi:FkbM family methyltransferase